MLISDCLSVYDTATDWQGKRYSHHLKALSVAMRDQRPEAEATNNLAERQLRGAVIAHRLPRSSAG